MRQFLLFLSCFYLADLSAQSANFVHYTSSRNINDLAWDGQNIWAVTDGGIICYDILTEQITHFNRGNSGIPIHEVLSIAIDAQGIRWLGTRIGLVRWQGNDFTVMNPNDNNGNPIQQNIHHLRIDAAGVIWMHTTEYGSELKSFDGQVWKAYDGDLLFNGLAKLDASPALPGVWVQGDEDTFYFFDGTTSVEHPLPLILPDPPGANTIYDWLLDSNGEIWFSSWKTLGVPNGGTWELEMMSFGPDAIALTPNGTLWAFDDYSGILVRHPDGNWEQISDEHNLFEGHSFEMLANDAGGFWLGTESSGLHHFENDVCTPILSSGIEIQENSIVDLAITSTQTVWATMGDDRRLFKFQDGQWQKSTDATPDAPHNYCKNLIKDGLSRLWLVSYSQAYCYDGEWKLISAPVEFPWELIYSVAVGSTANQVWIGGIDKIARYNGVGFQSFDTPSPDYITSALTVDKQGNVWLPCATNDGEIIAQFDGQNWIEFTAEDLEFLEFFGDIPTIEVAPNGDIWAFTSNEISKFDGISWQKFPLQGFTDGFLNTIAFDGDEKIWIGCKSNDFFGVDADPSLIKIENNTVQYYPYKSIPLPDPRINALAVDGHHNLWIGGESGGIAVFNEAGVTLGLEDILLTKGYDNLPATAFPNPTSTTSVVEYTLDQGSNVSLELWSMTGQLIQNKRIINQTPGKHQWQLPLNPLSQGSYCWRVLGENSVANGTIIIKGH